MASMLATIDAAILDVVSKIAAGKVITEYRLGSTMVKNESAAALLKQLQEMRSYYVAAESPERSASTAANYGTTPVSGPGGGGGGGGGFTQTLYP